MKLPDVNVWLAAAWARHSKHESARQWLDAETDDIGFCRVSQMTLLRLLTNPAVTKEDAMSRRKAWLVYGALIADSRVRFYGEPEGLEALWTAFSTREDKSHLLWTDDYLAAFAKALSAELVTLDRPLAVRHPSVRVVRLR